LLNAFCQRVLRINGQVPWMVHFSSYVSGEVEIGRRVWLAFALSGGCYIQGGNGVRIDDDTIFAPGVKIISANHDPDDLAKALAAAPVRIGKRCWLGANAVILPGVELGDDVVVGAGAVVTKSFPTGTVLAGVPAKAIGQRAPAKPESALTGKDNPT
jgi:acetyltransferase-like isoleucine patch superfamily enzyme